MRLVFACICRVVALATAKATVLLRAKAVQVGVAAAAPPKRYVPDGVALVASLAVQPAPCAVRFGFYLTIRT
jgi:hypothetical protein